MAFSSEQRRTAWTCFLLMAAMAATPPWLFRIDLADGAIAFRAGYAFLWSPPPPVAGDLEPVVWWRHLHSQLLVVGVGMVLLLFLQEARARTRTQPPSPSA
ncbi:MAG: hypothetical protein AB7O97_15340 [Planctomycetota bacterium]